LVFDSATSNQAYPSSLMGMMALLRQVNHDLKWYKKWKFENKDLSQPSENEKLVQIICN
jgi:hypothetical protein